MASRSISDGMRNQRQIAQVPHSRSARTSREGHSKLTPSRKPIPRRVNPRPAHAADSEKTLAPRSRNRSIPRQATHTQGGGRAHSTLRAQARPIAVTLARKSPLVTMQHCLAGILLSPMVIWLSLGIVFLWRQAVQEESLIIYGAFFLSGVMAWILCSFALPLPIRLYVIGHELTHVLFAGLFRVRAENLTISNDGGSVRLHGNNLLISLAPYVSPFYLLLIILFWEVGRTIAPIEYLHTVILSLAGMAFGFHVTFTIMCLSQFQPDLTHYGRFLSWVFILAGNLLLVQLILLWIGHDTLSMKDWLAAQTRALHFVLYWTARMWGSVGLS